MKIGINMDCYGELPLQKQISLMKENGFTACFTGNEYPEFDRDVETLQAAGISVDSLHAPFNKINEIWKVGEEGEQMLNRLIACAEAAARHGIPVIVVHLSSGITPPIISDIGNARFAKLMAKAKELGVTVAYENQRKLANLALMFEYYGGARFCWDIGHEACFTGGREYMPLFGDKLAALHIHDNSGNFNEDQHMIPYDAKIDFDKAANYIAQSGFDGTVMLEVIRHNSHAYDDLTPEEYYRRAGVAARRLAEKIEEYRK